MGDKETHSVDMLLGNFDEEASGNSFCNPNECLGKGVGGLVDHSGPLQRMGVADVHDVDMLMGNPDEEVTMGNPLKTARRGSLAQQLPQQVGGLNALGEPLSAGSSEEGGLNGITLHPTNDPKRGKSWAAVVDETNKQPEMNIPPLEKKEIDGKKRLTISQQGYEAICQPFRYSIIATLAGGAGRGRLDYSYIYSSLRVLWPCITDLKFTPVGKEEMLLNFDQGGGRSFRTGNFYEIGIYLPYESNTFIAPKQCVC